jgi:hypothetical protein
LREVVVTSKPLDCKLLPEGSVTTAYRRLVPQTSEPLVLVISQVPPLTVVVPISWLVVAS